MAERRAGAARPRPAPIEVAPRTVTPATAPAVVVRPGSADPARGDQVLLAAGNAVVSVARFGRLLGRSGLRIARQLPGAELVEAQARRLRLAAAVELARLLEISPSALGVDATAEEQRALLLVQGAGRDLQPLRTAMTELLERAGESGGTRSRDYLFGTIVSQLVPDEARILAALADGRSYALVDVVAKQFARAATTPVLVNATTVGRAAGITDVADTAAHVSRLIGFGLVELGPAADELSDHYDLLADDHAVRAARAEIDAGHQGSSRLIRRTLRRSDLGAQFWAACSPSP